MKYISWTIFILMCLMFPTVLVDSVRNFMDGEFTFGDIQYGALLPLYVMLIFMDIKQVLKRGYP